MPAWDYYPVSTLPTPLDIVWCRFPLEEYPQIPAQKSRPALVRQTAISEDEFHAEVEIVYGTSQLRQRDNPYDLYVQHLADMNTAGLHQATRFDLGRRLWVPWSREFFIARNGYTTPVIGHLPPKHAIMLKVLAVKRRELGIDISNQQEMDV